MLVVGKLLIAGRMVKAMSEEQKIKISNSKKGNSGGWKHTEESKIKIGLASIERGRENKLKKLQSFNQN